MKRNVVYFSISLVVILSMLMGLTASTAQSPAQPEVDLGEPGLSYRYVQTYGETQIPYLADTDHLNAPLGLFMDSSNNLYVTEQRGNRVLKYDSTPNNMWAWGTAGIMSTFVGPNDVTLDIDGNIWIANNSQVIQFDPSGVITQQLPDNPWDTGDDNSHFNDVEGITIDTEGRMFVSDANNHRVQVYDLTSGILVYSSTLGVTGEPGDDNNHFNHPWRITVDSLDQLYVADSGNGRVQKCTYASAWSCASLDTGLNNPQGLTVDGNDNVYIADTNNSRIRKCTSDGTCTDFATNTWGYSDLAVDTSGNVYGTCPWCDFTVVKYDSGGQLVGPYLGVQGVPYLTDGYHYFRPTVNIDLEGNILISEEWGFRLDKLDPDGNFLWSFGEPGVFYPGDNNHFCDTQRVAADSSGKIYVPDRCYNRVQIIGPDGNYINTLGTGGGTGNYQFNSPMGVAIDPNDYIYVVDQGNHRVMIYDQYRYYFGQIGVTGECGADNNHFCQPTAVAVDSAGNIYVVDSANQRVQKFDSNMDWQMTIGTGISGNQFDQFAWPNGIAVDTQGKIYVNDYGNNRLQVFDPTGAYLTTIGGVGGTNSSQFVGPSSVAVDREGNVYVSEQGNDRIQKFAPGVPDWMQVNINGFGKLTVDNLPSMEVFNNYLYAGTSNYTDNTHHIFRTTNSYDWEEINQDFDGGIASLSAYDGQLFAGTWGGSIWSSPDGLSWTPVLTNSLTLASFGQYNDTLYAGTYCSDVGATIWQYDGETWSEFVTNGNGDPSACGVTSSAEFEGNLYFGVADWSGNAGGRIWRTDGTDITVVVGDGFGDPWNANPAGLTVLGDWLYASIDHGSSFQVWRSNSGDTNTWSKVLEVNLDDSGTGWTTALIVHENHLFLTAEDSVGGMQVWRSTDGLVWEQIGFQGFGDSNNGYAHNLKVFNDQLYIGVNNYANGGEIWRYEPEVIASFNAAPTSGLAPLEVTFTNTSTGTLTANLWNFGDGITSTLTSPVHIYDTIGTYTVTLTADSFGNTDTITKVNFITVENLKFFLPVVRR